MRHTLGRAAAPDRSVRPGQRLRAGRGFTLLELLIAIVVVGLLAAVALPSFMDSVRKSRRSDAFAALNAVQLAQERWRANRATYAGSITNAANNATTPGLGLPETSSKGYYSLSINVDSGTAATAYDVVAVGISGTSQASDAQCRRLGVRVTAGQMTYAGCGPAADCTLAYSNTHACWAR